ncbi:MAG: S-layer homology domain-containing protein [Tissierellia bacterium]|nr:S-layer homology domain-containing protein [Tissierellia bacterium]
MRKKFFVGLIFLCILISAPVIAAPKDIQGHWAEKNIQWAIDQGIIQGYPDGTFKPNQSITKAEYYRITNQSEPVEIDPNIKADEIFKDVNTDSWYYKDVQAGLSSGYLEKEEFLNPNEAITREDAVRIISHTQGWEENSQAIKEFRDYNSISEKYKGLVGAAVSHNLVKGYPDGTLRPKSSLTRAEVVTMIKNLKDKNEPKKTKVKVLVDGKEVYFGKGLDYQGELLLPLNPIINHGGGGINLPELEGDESFAKDQDFNLKEGMEFRTGGVEGSCDVFFISHIGSSTYSVYDYDKDPEGEKVYHSFRAPCFLKDGYIYLHPKDIEELTMDYLGYKMNVSDTTYTFIKK